MKNEILNLVKEMGDVTFLEIDRKIKGFSGGDKAFCNVTHPQVIFWTNISDEGIEAITSLEKEGKIKKKPCEVLNYLIEGEILNLPLLVKNRIPKKDSWLPVVIIRGPNA